MYLTSAPMIRADVMLALRGRYGPDMRSMPVELAYWPVPPMLWIKKGCATLNLPGFTLAFSGYDTPHRIAIVKLGSRFWALSTFVMGAWTPVRTFGRWNLTATRTGAK